MGAGGGGGDIPSQERAKQFSSFHLLHAGLVLRRKKLRYYCLATSKVLIHE